MIVIYILTIICFILFVILSSIIIFIYVNDNSYTNFKNRVLKKYIGILQDQNEQLFKDLEKAKCKLLNLQNKN